MKVLDLQCASQHSFEGWFGSEADFLSQQARGLVTCPLCGDASIQKKLSAPRLNLRASRSGERQAPEAADQPQEAQVATTEAVASEPPSTAMQARLMQAMRAVLANTEDVGDRFADRARAMHHGDAEPRSIRGQTTPEVARELVDEGIDIMPLPLMPALKETLQ